MEDFECLIIDDCSTDRTEIIGKEWEEKDKRFWYMKTPENLGLSMARMFGIRHAQGQYIQMLDADDMLDKNALAITSEAMDRDSSIHIAYGHLDIVSEDLETRGRSEGWPFDQFSWRGQMCHLNQPHYASLIRREVFERSGGYRKRQWRAEDAEFWCRVTSLGFRAMKVTNRSTLIYRNRNDSKSKGEPGDGDWTAWFPWRMGAANGKEGMNAYRRTLSGWLPQPNIVPFGAQGRPPKDRLFWQVHDYSYPRISAIIPVGQGHEGYLIDALDSLVAQTYPDWEAVVVNDTGEEWKYGLDSPVCGAPFARVISTKGKLGASAARNLGARHAKGEVLFLMDADDYLLPNCFEQMMAHFEVYNGIIYSGWLRNKGDGSDLEYYKPNEFQCTAVLDQMQHAGTSILTPRWVHDKIVEHQGGWDENMESWEEWDYQIAAQAIAGACSYHIDAPLFVYRTYTGMRREAAAMAPDEEGKETNKLRSHLLQYIAEKWDDYYKKRKKIVCGCKQRKKRITQSATKFTSSGNFQEQAVVPQIEGSMVKLQYLGPSDAAITYKGPATRTPYRFGKTSHAIKLVYAEDAKLMLARTVRGGKKLFTLVEEVPVANTPEPGDIAQTRGVEDGTKRPEFPKMPMMEVGT
jgi:glycosyltransferase involved in cell wall biosynthesis